MLNHQLARVDKTVQNKQTKWEQKDRQTKINKDQQKSASTTCSFCQNQSKKSSTKSKPRIQTSCRFTNLSKRGLAPNKKVSPFLGGRLYQSKLQTKPSVRWGYHAGNLEVVERICRSRPQTIRTWATILFKIIITQQRAHWPSVAGHRRDGIILSRRNRSTFTLQD